MDEAKKIVEEIQQVAHQMYLDDIEENPDSEFEYFDCCACAESKCLAGSIQYGKYRLCNDCVVMAEAGFKLGKIKNIQELIDATEDKRLEVLCDYIKKDAAANNN